MRLYRLSAARLFNYADARRYRLGVNYHQIFVNAARCPVHSNHRDGRGRVDGNYGGRPHYEPNSFIMDDPAAIAMTDAELKRYLSTPDGRELAREVIASRHVQAQVPDAMRSEVERLASVLLPYNLALLDDGLARCTGKRERRGLLARVRARAVRRRGRARVLRGRVGRSAARGGAARSCAPAQRACRRELHGSDGSYDFERGVRPQAVSTVVARRALRPSARGPSSRFIERRLPQLHGARERSPTAAASR